MSPEKNPFPDKKKSNTNYERVTVLLKEAKFKRKEIKIGRAYF